MASRIMLNLSLDPDLAQALDAFVASTPDENRSTVARKALSEYLRRRARRKRVDDLDATDIELAREAKRRMEDPNDEVIPYDQARAELGL